MCILGNYFDSKEPLRFRPVKHRNGYTTNTHQVAAIIRNPDFPDLRFPANMDGAGAAVYETIANTFNMISIYF